MSAMRIVKRVLLAAAMSWSGSVTLGLLFAACASGHFSINTLSLPAVIPVAIFISTEFAIVLTPFTVWAVRTGMRNLCIYGPLLWVILAAYILMVGPRHGFWGLYGPPILGAIGLIILGLIPAPKMQLKK